MARLVPDTRPKAAIKSVSHDDTYAYMTAVETLEDKADVEHSVTVPLVELAGLDEAGVKAVFGAYIRIAREKARIDSVKLDTISGTIDL